jgi:hypothetical protein
MRRSVFVAMRPTGDNRGARSVLHRSLLAHLGDADELGLSLASDVYLRRMETTSWPTSTSSSLRSSSRARTRVVGRMW